MQVRREQLLRIRQRRRRRARLMLVCLGTALACGIVAGAFGPRVLTGDVAPAPAAAAAEDLVPPANAAGAGLLELSERLTLDPREIQANEIRWAALTERDRRAVLDRYWRLAGMAPADRERVLQHYAAFRDLPEQRQEFLRARAQKLQDFIQSLSPQDQAMLEGMSDTARAQRLLELWRARHKAW